MDPSTVLLCDDIRIRSSSLFLMNNRQCSIKHFHSPPCRNCSVQICNRVSVQYADFVVKLIINMPNIINIDFRFSKWCENRVYSHSDSFNPLI